MTINQLEYFIAIIEQGNFLNAAEYLHLSQSSLSKSMQRLEDELGVKLFDRSHRKAVLTAEGQAFYEGSLNTVAAHHQTMRALASVSEARQHRLRLITLPVLAQYGISKRLKSFRTAHPEAALSIEEMEDIVLLEHLKQNQFDLAIVREELLDHKYTGLHTLAVDELVAVLPVSHPLASRATIALNELSAEQFILMNPYISVHQLCLDACRRSGFEPEIIRTARVESILSAVQEEEGISLLMKANTRAFKGSELAFIPLQNPIFSRIVAVIPNEKKAPTLLKQLIDALISV